MNQSVEIPRNKFSLVTVERRIQSAINNISMELPVNVNSTLNATTVLANAEEYLISQLSFCQHQETLQNPKLSSSAFSNKDLQTTTTDLPSFTFNVDFASTPKKIIQRSSTQKHISLTIKLPKQVKKRNTCGKKEISTKIFPKPLLTSSFHCKPVKTTKAHQKINSKRHTRIHPHQTSTPADFKFPVRYLNIKTKDIDRINFNQNCNDLCCIRADYKLPTYPLTSFNSQSADYKFWIL